MSKLFSFNKRTYPEQEEKKPEVFLMQSRNNDVPFNEPVKLELDNLTTSEFKSYTSWWRYMDPFDIGKADNARVFELISGCGLSEDILEKVISLFPDTSNGVCKEQFFAMLRLIAHAQKGRKVDRDMIYLGASLPIFRENALSRSKSVPQNYRMVNHNSTTRLTKNTENGSGLLLTQGFKPNKLSSSSPNNLKYNSNNMPPPPVPPQSTKPTCPKYTRRRAHV